MSAVVADNEDLKIICGSCLNELIQNGFRCHVHGVSLKRIVHAAYPCVEEKLCSHESIGDRKMTSLRSGTVIGVDMFFNDLFTHALSTLDMWWGQACLCAEFFEMGALGFRRLDFGNRCVQTSKR